jgi:hypothetical protein
MTQRELTDKIIEQLRQQEAAARGNSNYELARADCFCEARTIVENWQTEFDNQSLQPKQKVNEK